MIKRIGAKMKLYPGFAEEYRKRHERIWPEMISMIKEMGIRNYSIFLDEETDTLFSYYEQEPGTEDIEPSEIRRKWWTYMADIMETYPDDSPVSVPLKQVFFLE